MCIYISPVEAVQRFADKNDIVIIGASQLSGRPSISGDVAFLAMLNLKLKALRVLRVVPEFIPTSPPSDEIGIMISEGLVQTSSPPETEIEVGFLPDTPKHRRKLKQLWREVFGEPAPDDFWQDRAPVIILEPPGDVRADLRHASGLVLQHLRLRAQGQQAVPRDWIVRLSKPQEVL